MKYISLAFFFIAATVFRPVLAQTHFQFTPLYNLDKTNLLKRLKAAKTDTEKLNRLNDLVFYYSLVESPEDIDTVYLNQLISLNQSAGLVDDGPYQTLRQGLRAGKRNNISEELTLLKKAVDEFDMQNLEIASLLTEMRYLFNVTNKQEEKFEFYSKKTALYLEKGEYYNAAACYHCIAGYFKFKGDMNSAINNYLKASGLYKPFSILWFAHDVGIVGDFYCQWGNLEKGLYYLQKALDLEARYKLTSDSYNVLSSFAEAEYNIGHYEISLTYLKKMDSMQFGNSTIDSISSMENSIVLKALNLIAIKRLPEAYQQLQRVKKMPPLSGIVQLTTFNLYDIDYGFYKYYMAINARHKAEAYLLNCYHRVIKGALVNAKIVYLRKLAQFYGDQNDPAKAWKYTVLYNRINDSLQNLANGFKVASYESEQKEIDQNNKLVALRQQRAVEEATIAQRNIIIWLSLAGLLVVLASLIFIYKQLRVNKQNLNHLKITQTQLVQREKMASLGELTAGIAHEIQNPLNFVNNFSEVNQEMLEELKAESKKPNAERDEQLEIELINDIIQNEEKINHHGKRADSIVKGMLEHSRSRVGEKEPTDINTMADEFLRLSYHGLRSKYKSFNAELVTHFDPDLPKVNVSQQDMGRVMLNLFNNAFYAVNQKQKTAAAEYKPEVSVTTLTENGQIIIKVKDNGVGIPDAIKEKIMQPFFTTKPTGEGTGLGLSLTYDMVVKGHEGKIDVNTKEGEFTEFIVTLPL